MKTAFFLLVSMFWTVLSVQGESGKPIKKHLRHFHQAVDPFDSLQRVAPTFEFSNTFDTMYMWRGLVFNEGLMLQPNVSVAYRNWEVSGWSNVVAVETAGHVFVPELQFSAAYVYETDRYGVKPQANFF